jgi:hypothetical protein
MQSVFSVALPLPERDVRGAGRRRYAKNALY